MAEHDNEQQRNAEEDAPHSSDASDADAQELPADDNAARDADAQEVRSHASGKAETDSSSAASTEEALDDVESAAKHLQDEAEQSVSDTLNLPELGQSSNGETSSSQSMGLLSDVSMNVTIELGRTRMYVEDVLKLNGNSIVELDKAAGDPVDIYVNDCHVARGEVLVLNENFCVRVSEIVASPSRVTREQ